MITGLNTFLIVGARPNFMKIAPIFKEMKKYPEDFNPIIVHTGQHYDKKMSKIFFDDLELPKPDIYLGVGSNSHAGQTADIMVKFEGELLNHKPDLIILVGDVNSTLACSLTASKIRYDSQNLTLVWNKFNKYIFSRKTESPICSGSRNRKDTNKRPLIAHVEAGLRSFDFDMPEEINRNITDNLSDLLFTSCRDGDNNLISEGYDPRKIFFVGNVMIDALCDYKKKAESSNILEILSDQNIGKKNNSKIDHFVLVTLHRPSNVDDPQMLQMILFSLIDISQTLSVIFPVHPRTKKLMTNLDLDLQEKLRNSDVVITDPIGYFDFLHLQTQAKLVITDSGGIQEETSYLGVPCLTIRPNTERPITISEGTNKLIKLDRGIIVSEAKKALNKNNFQPANIRFWDGQASDRIVNILKKIFTV